MAKKSESGSYVQCTICGHIYKTEKLNIEELYIDKKCPQCGGERALYIGEDSLLGQYDFGDPSMDDRYYGYKDSTKLY